MDLADLQRLVDAFEASDWNEIHLAVHGVEVHLSATGDGAAGSPPPQALSGLPRPPPPEPLPPHRSGTGVLFTRDPQSGDTAPMGEFLPRGQGEDVVSGEVDPLDLADLAQRQPEVHAALLDGMIAARAVCTEVGGRTSHAALVSRELGCPAVVGCGEGMLAAVEGRTVTVDGTAGEILDGIVPVRTPEPSEVPAPARLVAWTKEHPDAVAADHPLVAL